MSRSRLYYVLTHLHRTHQAEGLPDADLLARFAQLRDEAAFELLVWRHQRMVLGVCRRLLRDAHDAEDAFQAAFLTLARKAPCIGRREAVASWLYKVAYRCALRVRQTVRRQRQAVDNGVDPANVAVADSSLAAVEQDDLRELLDEEVQRLPAKYRAAVVLCYLEGKSYQQAAIELGCPAGTLSARLHTAREKLRRRLTARGIAPAAALALLEGTRETHAAARLATVAVQAAGRILAGQSAADVVSSRTLEVATGVMQAMSASRQKIIALVLLMGCLSGLTSWAALRALPQTSREKNVENADKLMSVNKGGKSMTWQECARLLSACGQFPAHVAYFAPDGSALAAVNGEGILRLWNTSNWEPRWQYDPRRRYGNQFQLWEPFSPDRRLIHISGRIADAEKPGRLKSEMLLLDAANGREVARLPGSDLKYSPDKTKLATSEKDCVTLWDARTFQRIRRLKTAAPADGLHLVFSNDGTLVCIPTKGSDCGLWETATGKERAKLQGFFPRISPDGKSLLTVLPGGIVKSWDTADGRERAVVRKEGRNGCMAAFSSDGQRILVWAHTALKANGVFVDPPRGPTPRHIRPIDACLYDAATGTELQRLPGDNDHEIYPNFSPDGRTIAYSRLEPDETEHEEVVLWDVPSGRERAVLRVPHGKQNPFVSSGVHNPFFSPDGTTIATTDPFGKNLRLWNGASGRPLLDLPPEVRFAYFSSDGQWLAGTPDAFQSSGTIRVFHLSDKPLRPPVVRGTEAKPTPPPPSPPSQPEPPKSEAVRALEAVRQDTEKYEQQALPKLREIEAGPKRKRLEQEWSEAHLRFGTAALKVVRDFPADPAALEALEFVLHSTNWDPAGELSKLRDEAIATILCDHRRSPNLTFLLYTMSRQYTDSADKALVEIAESNPHRAMRGRAAWVLACELADKSETSRLIRALPEMLDDPELDAATKSRLKKWRDADPDAIARQAEQWYAKARDQYADIPLDEVNKETLGQNAEHGLFALRNLALGKLAPDIESEDLDGKRFHLNEYRGKVVVLIFCGHWCGPCRQLNPQKQQLVERYADKPFALVEVNSDEDRETVKRIMRKEKLTWRCWFDGGREGPIARRWGVHRWPTIFVLDGKGVIRYKDLRGPMLDRVVDRLLKESEPEPRP